MIPEAAVQVIDRLPQRAGRASRPAARRGMTACALVLCLLAPLHPGWATEEDPAIPQAAANPTGATAASPGATSQPAAAPLDPAQERQKRVRELSALNQTIRVNAERQAELAHEIAALDQDRTRLNQAILDVGERRSKLEKTMAATESRIAEIETQADGVRASFNARRATLAEIIATLERIGRQPPPAIAVDAADARSAVRSAMLLGAVLPEIRIQADSLAADLQEIARLSRDARTERARLAKDAEKLAEERERLSLLVEEKRKARETSAEQLNAERAAAEELASKATSLQGLIGTLERDLSTARKAADDARAASSGTRPSAGDPSRLAPAVAFASTRGHLPYPAAGPIEAKFGDDDGYGGQRQGIVIGAAPGAQVSAPADGWVVYAGPFRSYGKILILNLGDGYHMLLAGMDRIDVDLGQFVLAGEPVGTVAGQIFANAVAAAKAQPQSSLYVELRKDSAPIDPAPWWAATGEQEVRG